MTLTDDNFASIVAAVKKVAASSEHQEVPDVPPVSNIGEILLMMGATLLGFPCLLAQSRSFTSTWRRTAFRPWPCR